MLQMLGMKKVRESDAEKQTEQGLVRCKVVRRKDDTPC